MNTIDKVRQFKALWRIALPHVAEPSPEDAVRWCLYPVEIVESSILQAAKRFAIGKMPADFVPAQTYKYVTATARHIAQRKAVTGSFREQAPVVMKPTGKDERI